MVHVIQYGTRDTVWYTWYSMNLLLDSTSSTFFSSTQLKASDDLNGTHGTNTWYTWYRWNTWYTWYQCTYRKTLNLKITYLPLDLATSSARWMSWHPIHTQFHRTTRLPGIGSWKRMSDIEWYLGTSTERDINKRMETCQFHLSTYLQTYPSSICVITNNNHSAYWVSH